MLNLRQSAIARKLTWMTVLVSGTALLVAGLAFFAYDQYTFSESLVRNLTAQAQIIGSNSVSALLFSDPQTAENTLSALRNQPDIIAGGILTLDGRVFARYSRSPGESFAWNPKTAAQNQALDFRSDELLVRQPVMFQGRQVGTVYIRSDLHERRRRLLRYLAIAAGVLLLAFLASLGVSAAFRRSVAAPVVELADTARVVSEQKNYAVRVAPTGRRDEIAVLIDAFNNMLAQIQERARELLEAHGELEQRVEERTRQLIAANRELEAFSHSVSHDLRAPLEVINGFSHVLMVDRGASLDGVARDCVQQINGATRRMSELIDDLLNLSRVSSASMHRERVDLTAIAQKIADQLCRREPSRRVDFVIRTCAPVQGDARLLAIAMENLLSNAWKYTSHHASARIEFSCEERRGRMVYFVRDDGAGFDPQLADQLFKPFHRLHPISEFQGTGVGLATVQRIIFRHNGEIWADGAIEKGATFYFSLA